MSKPANLPAWPTAWESPPSPSTASDNAFSVVTLQAGDPTERGVRRSPAGDAGARLWESILPRSGRLVDAFTQICASRGDHPAIAVGGGSYSYRWVANAARAVAHFLRFECQSEPGARVALLLDNSPEYLAGFYGALLAGAVAVPLPVDIEPYRLAHVVRTCNIAVVLTKPRIASMRADLSRQTHGGAASVNLTATVRDRLPKVEPMRVAGQTLAMILFTAGSTGDPKGVMLSDANLLANARSILEYLPIDAHDRALALMPFCHAYGNSVMQTHVLAGATLVVDGSLVFPSTVVDALRRHRATSFAAVPEAYRLLLRYADLERVSRQDLHYMTVAGGALDAESVLAVSQRIAPAQFYVMYGQSEATARLAYLPPEQLARRPDSIGKAIAGVELAVVDPQGRTVAPGELGELCARGPNVMLGYWNDPETTSRTIREGWLHTGDLAAVDAQGCLYVKARKSELVKIQGLRVHPREIERIVSSGLSGDEAIVVPYRFAQSTRLALYVVPRERRSVSAEEVRRFCLRELPGPKRPAHVEILAEAPLTPAMKIDRPALAQRAASLAGGGFAAISTEQHEDRAGAPDKSRGRRQPARKKRVAICTNTDPSSST